MVSDWPIQEKTAKVTHLRARVKAPCAMLWLSGAGEPMTEQQTVLIVDDDPSMLLICRKALESEGFHVLEASGSSETLKICAEYADEIHLLLSDLFLPPPDFRLVGALNEFPRTHGHQLLARVVAMRTAIRIVCMSSASASEIAAHGMKLDTIPFELDTIPFLEKPFPVENLLRIVRATLAGPPLVSKEPVQTATKGKDIPWYG